jgi:hypothetical protein
LKTFAATTSWKPLIKERETIMAATLIVVAAIEMRMMNLENAPLGALANLLTILNESFNP